MLKDTNWISIRAGTSVSIFENNKKVEKVLLKNFDQSKVGKVGKFGEFLSGSKKRIKTKKMKEILKA
jgi:hypothetical protein